jgi:hypothetical protein
MFYRFELMARRAGLPWYATEKWVSYFYEATSNFGHSILRPWFWLIVSILFFGLIYRIIGLSFNVAIVGDNSGYAEAFELSFARAFQPLSFWSDSLVGGNLLGQQLVVNPASKWSAVVMYILGTLQSLISIILLFLSGLALRRRFQIN